MSQEAGQCHRKLVHSHSKLATVTLIWPLSKEVDHCHKEFVTVTAYVVPRAVLPQGMDLLLGLPFLKQFGAKPDSRNTRLEITDLSLVINLLPLQNLLTNLHLPPQRVLDLCSGISPAYHTMRDLGYDYSEYHASESDDVMRKVADYSSQGIIEHLWHDMLAMPDELPLVYDVIIATPECGPWSVASGPKPPKGFDEPTQRPQLFKKACTIINDQLRRNPALFYILENVLIHPKLLPDQANLQETYLGAA